MFRFEKVYMDLVDPSGTVCIAYLARLRLLGRTTWMCGFELYGADGGREVQRGIARPHNDFPGTGGRIDFAFAGGLFRIEHEEAAGPWVPAGPGPAPDLLWSVLTPRARASVEVIRGSGARHFVGSGYADWVAMTRPPRWLGISRLQWGRAHCPGEALVFVRIDADRRPVWQRTLRLGPGDARIERADAQDTPAVEHPASWSLRPPERVLHRGHALEAARFPGALERALSRAVGGTLLEQRVLARWVATQNESAPGWALSERVEFRARRRARATAD